jgi:tetratricopeptide (TPR) repeat protein
MVIALAILSLTLQTSQADRQAAKRLFSKASQEYAQQNYEAALGDFTSAYRLAHVPEILYNLGQCHYELHQWRRAAYYYRRFLEARPHASVADQVRTRLADLDQMEAAAPPANPAVKPEVANPPPANPPPTEPEQAPLQAVTEPEHPEAPATPAGPSHAISLALAGGAAVCAVIGVFGVLRVVDYTNLSSQWQPGKEISLQNYQYAQQSYTNAQNWEWGATALFALTAGGVVGSVLTW